MGQTASTGETYRVNTAYTPAIFNAFQIITSDSGAGVEWFEIHRTVPARHADQIYKYERWLRALDFGDLQTFCIGEETEQKALRDARPGGEDVAKFLTDFWMGWELPSTEADGAT